MTRPSCSSDFNPKNCKDDYTRKDDESDKDPYEPEKPRKQKPFIEEF